MTLTQFQRDYIKRHAHAADDIFDASGKPAISAGTISVVFDGGGSVIATGLKGFVRVPFAATIVGVDLLADQAGSLVVDIWKDSYANHPPTVADSITASAKPTLSSAVKSTDDGLSGWTVDLAEGDILAVNVDSAATVTLATLVLRLERAQ